MSDGASGTPALTPKDFATEQEVRWCPGCGDYSILAQMKKVLAQLGKTRENTVFVSGIGCAARFPYYMNTFGLHGVHGRAPAMAAGIKCANPKLDVWAVGGDGDMLSIGGNHLIHAIRRNIDINILMFNNRIYGLTKGQYSPTSELGKKTKSSPFGTIDQPLGAISLALGAEATFVARTVDVDVKHLAEMLERAVTHKGTSFVEIYQDCNVFNHFAFQYASDKDTKHDHIVYLEHGKPLIFGKDRNKGIRLTSQMAPEIVDVGENGVKEDDLLFHDEKRDEPALAFILSRMRYPEFPEPMGVFRCVDRPVYDVALQAQVDETIKRQGIGDLETLLHSGDTWMVE